MYSSKCKIPMKKCILSYHFTNSILYYSIPCSLLKLWRDRRNCRYCNNLWYNWSKYSDAWPPFTSRVRVRWIQAWLDHSKYLYQRKHASPCCTVKIIVLFSSVSNYWPKFVIVKTLSLTHSHSHTHKRKKEKKKEWKRTKSVY